MKHLNALFAVLTGLAVVGLIATHSGWFLLSSVVFALCSATFQDSVPENAG